MQQHLQLTIVGIETIPVLENHLNHTALYHGNMHMHYATNVFLLLLCRLPRAKKFLERRVEYLKETYSPEGNSVDSSTLHTSLASCYQKLGDCEKALEQARLALEADAGDKEARWTYELLSRQKIVADKICKAKVKLQEKTCCLSIPEPVQVCSCM